VNHTTRLLLFSLVLGCPAADDDDSASRTVYLDDPFLGDDDDLDEGTPVAVPASFLAECAEAEPNDAPVLSGETLTLDPPWADSTDCGALPTGSGPLLAMRGRIDHVIDGSWEGDNDAFTFTVTEEIRPRVVVQWDPLWGDFDARLWCLEGSNYDDAASGGLASVNRPEQITQTVFPLTPGMRCELFVVAFSGGVSDYVAWLEVD